MQSLTSPHRAVLSEPVNYAHKTVVNTIHIQKVYSKNCIITAAKYPQLARISAYYCLRLQDMGNHI